MNQPKPVLILGGTGQAGRDTAALLRRWYPDLPLTVAGRDLARAQRVADELGGASAVVIDLQRADLGLPSAEEHAAVVATLWDRELNGLHHAQQQGIPYLSISSGLVDIPFEVVAAAQGPAPVLLASHFCAGTATLAAVHVARELDRVDAVRVGAVLDEQDSGGPAGEADLERWAVATSAGLQRRDGVFTWTDGSSAGAQVAATDGVLVAGQAVPILDVPSIAAATGARDVRFDLAVGESAGRRQGGSPSAEILFEIDGVDGTGAPRRIVQYLVHRNGQRPLTALGIALGVERLLGLQGTAVAAGIHTPESLIDPAHAIARLTEIGAEFVDAGDRLARVG